MSGYRKAYTFLRERMRGVGTADDKVCFKPKQIVSLVFDQIRKYLSNDKDENMEIQFLKIRKYDY